MKARRFAIGSGAVLALLTLSAIFFGPWRDTTMSAPGAVQNLRVEPPGDITGARVLWDAVPVPDGATRVMYDLRWGPVGSGWGEKYDPPNREGQLLTDRTSAVLTGSGFPVGATGELQILAFNPDATTAEEKWGPISSPLVFTVFDVQEPDPDPEPAPDTPVQEFDVVTPAAGDTGITIKLTWVEPLDSVTIRVGQSRFAMPAGTPGAAETKFLSLGRPLEEGELLVVDSVSSYAGQDNTPFPDPPYQVEVGPVAEDEPVPEPTPDPEPEPDPEPADNPIVSAVPMPGELDSMIVTWADGSRAEVRRLSSWLGVFDWLVGAVWLSKKIPPA